MTVENDISGSSKPILKGFTVALRDREFFHLLNDIFVAMDAVQKGLEPKLARGGHHFLNQNYDKQIALVWDAIKLQYESFTTTVSVPRSKRSDEKLTNDEVDDQEKKIDQTETETLESRFQALFPSDTDSRYEAVSNFFLRFFSKTPSKNLPQDRQLCLEALQRICLHLASHKTPAELELRQKNHKEAHESYLKRQTAIGTLFNRASAAMVPANSATMRSLLMSRRNRSRVPFYDGGRANSLDGELGGFHGSGLTCFVGGTSGFKTGLMTSLIANHVMRYIDELDQEPAEVWCYIGEDGEEAYPRRILVNIINRIARRDPEIMALIKSVRKELTIGTFDYFLESQDFSDFVDSLLSGPLSGLYFIRAPETPEEMATFSIINVLNVFDAKITNEGKKPRFIVIDYLNLLRLPRSYAFNNRAEEISSISHILDEWGNLHKIPVITAAQASADGNLKAREEMLFYNQEHIHECRSVQHHARMMISILTYDDVTTRDENGRPVDRMALKILKNRDGRKLDIFRTGLDFARNIALLDSEMLTEEDWLRHRMAIFDAKASISEGIIGDGRSTSGRPGAGRSGGNGNGRMQGGSFAGGGRKPTPPPPQVVKPKPQASVQTVTPQEPKAKSVEAETPAKDDRTKTADQDDSGEIYFDEFTSAE
jgi:hypothetical protein